jgi:hypothetical protein
MSRINYRTIDSKKEFQIYWDNHSPTLSLSMLEISELSGGILITDMVEYKLSIGLRFIN